MKFEYRAEIAKFYLAEFGVVEVDANHYDTCIRYQLTRCAPASLQQIEWFDNRTDALARFHELVLQYYVA